MKKILYLTLFLCLLSCSSGKQSERLTLEKAIEVAGTASNANDSLFLGFNFGMDSCLVERKVDSLIQAGKLFHKDGYLRYSFNINPVSYRPAIGFAYTNDTLSKVSLAFLNEENLTVELIKSSVAAYSIGTFTEKGYTPYQKKNELGSNDYYFIKNNTIVSIKGYQRFVLMSYSNAIVDVLEQQKAEDTRKSLSKQTQSDI